MKTKKNIALLLALLILGSVFAGSLSAQQKDTKSSDWREDYAYTLGVQAYIFSYLRVRMEE